MYREGQDTRSKHKVNCSGVGELFTIVTLEFSTIVFGNSNILKAKKFGNKVAKYITIILSICFILFKQLADL